MDKEKCPDCKGKKGHWYTYGIHAQDWTDCETCDGTGLKKKPEVKEKVDKKL